MRHPDGARQCSQASGVVTCNTTSLAPGAAPPITIIVTVSNTPGIITNTATVSTNSFDPVAGNNTASATTTVGVAATATPTVTPTNTPTTVAATPTRTPTPIAGVAVPTRSFPMLALRGMALAGAALLILKR